MKKSPILQQDTDAFGLPRITVDKITIGNLDASKLLVTSVTNHVAALQKAMDETAERIAVMSRELGSVRWPGPRSHEILTHPRDPEGRS